MILTDDLAQAVAELLENPGKFPSLSSIVQRQLNEQIKQNRARWALVRLSITNEWNTDVLLGAKAWCIYLVDRNETTNCAELTPSYTLYPVYYDTDSLDARVRETVASEPLDRDVKYVHCKEIERMLVTDGARAEQGKIDEPNDLCETYSLKVEQLIEHYQGNHVL